MAAPVTAPFSPGLGEAQNTTISLTSASASVPIPPGFQTVRFSLPSSAPQTFISFWAQIATGATATTSSMSFLPGATEVQSIPAGANNIAAIVASGTGTLYISFGTGT